MIFDFFSNNEFVAKLLRLFEGFKTPTIKVLVFKSEISDSEGQFTFNNKLHSFKTSFDESVQGTVIFFLVIAPKHK